LSRFRRTDDGAIAVLAAVTFPLVLTSVALAFAAIVWSSSESEAQRAADAAAVRAAATAFLGADFPYSDLPGVTTPLTYPDVDGLAALAHLTPPADVSQCGTVGLPPGVVNGANAYPTEVRVGGVHASASVSPSPHVPEALVLPANCAAVGPYAVPPPLAGTDQSNVVACSTATQAMTDNSAPYANRFYKGGGDSVPSCDNRRVRVKLATGSPLLGFGQNVTDSAGNLATDSVSQLTLVEQALATLGVHLDTSLPSLMCPEISVMVDQPVREPVFDVFSTPNGRSTARRIVKNAVVVPVYNGQAISSTFNATAHAAAVGEGVAVTLSNGTTVTIPPQNLNALLIAQQHKMLGLLDQVDALVDATLKAANVSADALNGTFTGVDPKAPQAPPGAASPLQSLRVTKCLRDTLAQVYDPPSGDAPTAEEVMEQAASSGEQILVVQVGAVQANCNEVGAIDVSPVVTGAPECIRTATTPQVNPLTGVYEVPFFDVTPALVQDIGHHDFEAVPLHASQASGAFRGGLVRDKNDTRYDPDVRQPVPVPQCTASALSSACQILSVTPSPVVLPTLPTPTPTPSLPTLPPVLPTPTPTPTPTPSPTPSPTCTGLLCVVKK
jgi:hypothetical protein